MQRKFLEELGLEKEVIDKIMAENGNDINKAKGDLEEVKQQLKTSQDQVETLTKELKTAKDKAGDNEDLKTQLENAIKKQKEDSEAYNKQLKDIKLTNAIKLAVAGKVYDENMAAGLFDKSQLVLTDDGEVIGINEQLEKIKKDKAFLFKTGEVKKMYNPEGGEPSPGVNPFSKEHYNLTEQGKLIKNNPAQAKELALAAGINLNI